MKHREQPIVPVEAIEPRAAGVGSRELQRLMQAQAHASALFGSCTHEGKDSSVSAVRRIQDHTSPQTRECT
jgi:hypothetical protein